MTLKELARLKEEMDAERRDKERAIGALEQLMKQLKKETDADTVDEAEELLKTARKKADQFEADSEKLLTAYREWKENRD